MCRAESTLNALTGSNIWFYIVLYFIIENRCSQIYQLSKLRESLHKDFPMYYNHVPDICGIKELY